MLEYYMHPFRAFAVEQTEIFGALGGVEVRHPLNSATMLVFAMACPVRLRRRNVVDRYMHREAMTGLLPPIVLERKSKATFDFIFRRALEPLSPAHLSPSVMHEWLNLRPEEFIRLMKSAGSVKGLSWADWSAWSLFACGTVQSAGGRR